MTYGVTPYEGILNASEGTVTFEQGGERWSNDEDGFPAAIEAASAADVAVVVVGTWSRDQNELWGGLNATTGKITLRMRETFHHPKLIECRRRAH